MTETFVYAGKTVKCNIYDCKAWSSYAIISRETYGLVIISMCNSHAFSQFKVMKQLRINRGKKLFPMLVKIRSKSK